MDSDKAGPSSRDKKKSKAPREGKGTNRKSSPGKAAGKGKEGVSRRRREGRWKPGDPLPDSPTEAQIKAHNDALLDAYMAKVSPERRVAPGWEEDPAYQELLWRYMYVPPEEGLPEDAETTVVVEGDIGGLFGSSASSSESSSSESSSYSGSENFAPGLM